MCVFVYVRMSLFSCVDKLFSKTVVSTFWSSEDIFAGPYKSKSIFGVKTMF